MYERHLQIAAEILGGNNGDAGLLNSKLANWLDNLVAYIDHTPSRQIIALAILTWEGLNPESRAYYHNG